MKNKLIIKVTIAILLSILLTAYACEGCNNDDTCNNKNEGDVCIYSKQYSVCKCVKIIDKTTCSCRCSSPSPTLAVNKDEDIFIGTIWGDQSEIEGQTELLCQFLSDQSGYEIELKTVPNPETVVSMLNDIEINFALIPFSTYFENRDSLNVTPLLVPEYEESGTYYRGTFIVPVESNTNSLADLQGAVFAYTSQDNLYGYLMPLYTLDNKGYDPISFFSEVISVGDAPIDMISTILYGAADVGIVWENEKSDARILVENEIPDVWDTTRTIASTPWIPDSVLVASNNLTEEMQTELRDALLKAANDDEGREALYAINQIVDMQELDDQFWDAVEMLEYAIELDLSLGGWQD